MTIQEALVAKAEKDFEKTFSKIPAEAVEKIAKLDPSTQLAGEDVQNIGFIAKQLLLPHYLENPEIFNQREEELAAAVKAYKENINKYLKPNAFKSIEDFLAYMQNPDAAEIEQATEDDAITKIYKKYYEKQIPDRAVFDTIIALDPGTSKNQIGELARNLLLRRYVAGETKYFDNEHIDDLQAAIDRFITSGKTYERDKQNPSNYASLEEFVTYQPSSPLISDAADPSHTRAGFPAIEGKDFIRIATTNNFEVFKILTFRGSETLAHLNGMDNVWCTAGGSGGTNYGANPAVDPPEPSSMWTSYQNHADIYMILSLDSRDRNDNFNLAVERSDHRVSECRDGHNCSDSTDSKFNESTNFRKILSRDPQLISAIATSSRDDNLKYSPTVQTLYKVDKLSESILKINSLKDAFKFMGISNELKGANLSIEINLPEIPAGMFEGQRIKMIHFGDAVENIGAGAFKGATLPKNFEFPKNLKIISTQAFANCGLSGSIRLPDSLEKIDKNAFLGTHGYKLKLNKFRTTKLSIAESDKEWAHSTIQLINGRDA